MQSQYRTLHKVHYKVHDVSRLGSAESEAPVCHGMYRASKISNVHACSYVSQFVNEIGKIYCVLNYEFTLTRLEEFHCSAHCL